MSAKQEIRYSWIPTYGKDVKLGMLYDYCTGTVIPNEFLWHESYIKGSTEKIDPHSKPLIETISGDSFIEKAKMLEMALDCQIDHLLGLKNPSVYAKFLDQRTPCNSNREILHYKQTFHLSTIPHHSLKNVDNAQHIEATHVVIGLSFEAHVFFVLDMISCDTLSFKLSDIVESIKNGNTEWMKTQLNDTKEIIAIQSYSNTIIPVHVATLYEAAEYWKDMPQIIAKTGDKLKPNTFFIIPLSQLNQNTSPPYFEIEREISKMILSVFEQLDYVIGLCTKLRDTTICSKFSGLVTEIRYFQEMVTRYRRLLREYMAILIPSVRRGTNNIDELLRALREKEGSPFSTDTLITWILRKQAEIKSLSIYISMSELIPENSMDWMDDAIVKKLNMSIDKNVEVQISRTSDKSLLDSMQLYLSKNCLTLCSDMNTSSHVHDMELCKQNLKPFQENKGDGSYSDEHHETNAISRNDISIVITETKTNTFTSKGDVPQSMNHSDKDTTIGVQRREPELPSNQKEALDSSVEREPLEETIAGTECRKIEHESLQEEKNTPRFAKKESKQEISYRHHFNYIDSFQADSKLVFQPKAPTVVLVTFDSVVLQLPNDKVLSFEICCKEIGKSNAKIATSDPGIVYEFSCLRPATYYEFSIRGKLEDCIGIYSETTKPILTKPTGPPGKPTVEICSMFKVKLKWTEPQKDNDQVEILEYVIMESALEGRSVETHSKKWLEKHRVKYGQNETELDVYPNIAYNYKVVPVCFLYARSVESEESDTHITHASPVEILQAQCIEKSTKIEERKKLTIYKVPTLETYKDKTNRIKKCTIGPECQNAEKVIMVVGATGAGKSTMINGMINYVYGVEFEDKFRFKLISEATDGKRSDQTRSQTTWITSYTIYHQEGFTVPYTLTILDTPGYGDTEGIKRDQQITKQITKFFQTPGQQGIDQLHAVGFVVQAALPRLTGTQKYIFDSILALFGKDLEENIFMLITFADANRPPVLQSLKKAELPWKNYFKFNNSALFPYDVNPEEEENENEDEDLENDNVEIDKMFWKMWKSSFNNFLKKLDSIETKSLSLTRGVLTEREQLELIIQNIRLEINHGLNMRENLQKEENLLKDHSSDIERNKNFKYTVEEEVLKTIRLEKGNYVTNCLQCNRTCHYPCRIAKDEFKIRCTAMRKGLCQVCDINCSWELHRNNEYRYEVVREKVTKTSDDLKKKYEEALGRKLNVEQLINQVKDEFEAVQIHVILLTEKSRTSIQRLKEIALKPSPLNTPDYIDILIQTEKSEKKEGWMSRINQLSEVREEAEFVSKISTNNFQPLGPHCGAYKMKIEEAKRKKKGGWWRKVISFFEHMTSKDKGKGKSEDSSWLMGMMPLAAQYGAQHCLY